MRAARNGRRNQAFTLVEILIVVVILGILAAIVVPQFTNAADEARNGNVVTQQRTLENQLELYRARNNGSYPNVATMWTDLVNGGYIKAAPRNPLFSGTPEQQTSVGATGGATAWFWDIDEDTGVGTLDFFDPNAEEEEEEEEEG